ncbi:proton-coupled zinc antiporter SLC30A1 [Amia ocellicauda]|uniref:proton-coupled zinc antiporter SLC30A1 n=1 Tax=Amia ocellicauda TaxID=2972642 RepID=UPI003463C4DF
MTAEPSSELRVMGSRRGWNLRHCCMLGLTVLVLVGELVVSRVCNSLINMVDSFNTLFMLLHLCLSPSAHSPPASPDPSTFNIPSTPCPSRPFGWARLRPLGALVSALLLSSLCISVSLDILGHILRPHPLQWPLLAAAAGATGLLFNAGVLFACCTGKWDPYLGYHSMADSLSSGLDDRVEVEVQTEESRVAEEEESESSDNLPRGPTDAQVHLAEDVLLYCNPGASSILDPDAHLEPSPSLPLDSLPEFHSLESWRQLDIHSEDFAPHGTPASLPHSVNKGILEAQRTCTDLVLSNPNSEKAPPVPCSDQTDSSVPKEYYREPVVEPASRRRGWQCGLPALLRVAQSLLASALVLANGLAQLVLGPECPAGERGCDLYVYLDPAFSLLAVVVLLAATLPQVKRYGFLLLQGVPTHIALDNLVARIRQLPGVLSIHELHVWQLSEKFLVASVHVHCDQLDGHQSLLAAITEIFQSVGVSCSTVQPEFHPLPTPQSTDPLPLPQCSLACRKECAKKLCCQGGQQHPPVPPHPGQLQNHFPELVIENTYL